jgi:PAS domain S-box-containing protein
VTRVDPASGAGIGPPEVERTAPRAHRPGRWFGRLPSSSFWVAASYALFASLWIAFSDRALEHLVTDIAARDRYQTVKGIAFVVITSILLHLLVQRSERPLRSVSAEMRATVEGMTDAVLVVDDRLHIVEANQAAADLFGVPDRGDLLGSMADWSARYQVRYADGTPVPQERLASVRAVLGGERILPYDAVVRSAKGKDVFISVTASPVEGRGRTRLAVAVLRDVSASRRLDELRDEFLSTAAHEFKTPLAVVKAYAQLLRKREPAEDQALAVILRQVERLNRLVEHLLDASRLRSGDRDLRRERFDLAALAAEVVERMRAGAPRHALAVHLESEATVEADRERIERVITSLVDNAIRFSPAGGDVAVSVARRDGAAVLSVEDHGVGIPAERQARIFERYYRAHAGMADDYGGLGVGLDMSRETVVRLGGRMWFESAPGEGSRFHFSLPLAGRIGVQA